jgi:hypothetical protein
MSAVLTANPELLTAKIAKEGRKGSEEGRRIV